MTTPDRGLEHRRPVTVEARPEASAEAGDFLLTSRQAQFWAGALLAFLLFLLAFRDILLPFVAGLALAYLLDPVADRLERLHLPRLAAVFVILAAFVVAFALVLLVLVPTLGDQFTALRESVPGYIQRLQQFVIDNLPTDDKTTIFGFQVADLQSSLTGLLSQLAQWGGGFAASLLSGGQALLSMLSLIVVTPVVAFYLLLDWDRMVAAVDGWLPRQHAPTIRALVREMDAGVSGFVRGQVSVCIILGCYYAIGLSLAGLGFGLLIGIGIGLISFIPYVGAFTGAILSIGLATAQFWPDWVSIALVAAVFVVGQFVEGNILQPKLIGGKVGLHPVWLMFALFAFASLFGFLGMLIAVPAAAAVGVVARYMLRRYLASRFYRGEPEEGSSPPIASAATGREPAQR
jgi:predicted PurR-regulated permease PerM